MYLILYLISLLIQFEDSNDYQLIGAWKDQNGVLIMTQTCFSYAEFSPDEFQNTYGGTWEISNDQVRLTYEFHTESPEVVGTLEIKSFSFTGQMLELEGHKYQRIDDAEPGKLSGAWLFYARVDDGEIGNTRTADNPRKTMKILSGTRFQWIAYNTETKSFHGTGGGTYTTENGKYVENIDFFSRDNSRVGASLSFDYEIKGDEWHHEGFSSKGDPLYEIWKMRKRSEF
jgi:hypothetical protein